MHLLWSQTIPAPLRGLSLARERETVLAWNSSHELYVFNHAGVMQAQRPAPVPLAAAGCAEDGSGYAIGGSTEPMVAWLAPDLAPRWQRALPQRVTALAVEPLGRLIAVADAGSTLHLFDRRGRTVWHATTPRPLLHLAFAPEKPLLLGAADFGLVLGFGASGECLWRDGLVAHVGSLAVAGDGAALLACFGDGLYRYGPDGPPQERIALDTACPHAALSYAGDCLLTTDRANRACLRDNKGVALHSLRLENAATAVALGALGDYAVIGLSNGAILRFSSERGS